MNRRGFLGALLALTSLPAVLRAVATPGVAEPWKDPDWWESGTFPVPHPEMWRQRLAEHERLMATRPNVRGVITGPEAELMALLREQGHHGTTGGAHLESGHSWQLPPGSS